ncbi:MAG: recombinase family protein [Legionella sp.]|nr:recombinase family protein [Legionella sp.]
MACYGYARVSSIAQEYSIQEKALRVAGCEVVRSEKVSGSKRNDRSELELLLQFLQPGDTLMVTRVDRLARSIKDLQDIVHELHQKKVILKAVEQPIDTRTASGKAFLDMLGVFAEFETNLRRERQLEGISAAKERGVYKGRKKKIDDREIQRLHREEKLRPTMIARRLGVGRTSVYRALNQSIESD